MLSKISQTQKGKYRMIYLQAALGGVKIIQTESGIVDARLGDGGRGGGPGISVSWGRSFSFIG